MKADPQQDNGDRVTRRPAVPPVNAIRPTQPQTTGTFDRHTQIGRAAGVVALQRAAGNLAVSGIIGPVAVQRDDPVAKPRAAQALLARIPTAIPSIPATGVRGRIVVGLGLVQIDGCRRVRFGR